VGAGAAARSAAPAGAGPRPRRHRRHSRPRRRAAVVAPDHGDEGRRGDRDLADRPGARRSARGLHAAARLVGAARMRTTPGEDRMTAVLEVAGVSKSFTMHLRGGVTLPVVRDVSFAAHAGECVVLAGPSGAGKSSILKMVFGSYRCEQGAIRVRHDASCTDIATAQPRELIALRRRVVGYVSQFLRAIPRVAALDVVAEPLLAWGVSREDAAGRAPPLLAPPKVPGRPWAPPPAPRSRGRPHA